LRSDAPSPEDKLAEESETTALSELMTLALETLPDRERFIIRNRYYAEAKKTFASIGGELDLSKDRVRQLEARALDSLREFLEPGLAERQITVK
jgi:RNA polymerase sigma-32 factor